MGFRDLGVRVQGLLRFGNLRECRFCRFKFLLWGFVGLRGSGFGFRVQGVDKLSLGLRA